MKARLTIYNLNGKEARWWRDLNDTKRDEVKDIRQTTFNKIFQEKYMSERFFDIKIKKFHELNM